MAATIREMGLAVAELASTRRRLLVELEEQTRRQGVEPGPDLAFAGLRVLVARGEDAAKFLISLAPYQEQFDAWFVARIADRLRQAAAGGV